MAFLFEDQDEDEQNPDGQQPSQVPGTGQQDPGGGVGGANAGSAPSSQRQFVDINAYLDANKEQTGALADRVTGKINEAGTKLRTDISDAENNFGQKVNEGSTKFDEGLYNRAVADPNKFVMNQPDLDNFTKMRTQTYGGPRDLSEVAPDLGGRVAADTARYKSDVDTSAGRKEFIRGISPAETPGMLSLDELLLGGDAGARAKLTGAANQFGEINSFLDEAGGRAKTKAAAAETETDAARNTTSSRLSGDIQGYQATLNDRLQAAYAESKARAAKAASTLKDINGSRIPAGPEQPTDMANFDPQVLADLGISAADLAGMGYDARQLKHAGDWRNPAKTPPMSTMPVGGGPVNDQIKASWMQGQPEFYNVDFDPTNFATQRLPEASFGLNELAGEDDYARAAALSQLSGNQDLGFLNPNDKSKAGTANLDVYDFNAGGATGAAKNQLMDKDKNMVASIMGKSGQPVTMDEIMAYGRDNKPFLTAVADGRTKFHSSNPDANARGVAAIRALARLGAFQMPMNNVIGTEL